MGAPKSAAGNNNRAMSFYTKDKHLYCEKLRVKDIQARVAHSPFYLYSLAQVRENYEAYTSALAGIESMVCYAFKANNNLHILRQLAKWGSGGALVSGNELKLAKAAGFAARRTVFNGNGKTCDELRLAVDHGAMVNIDSEFDIENIDRAATSVKKPVNVLIRINPDLDPEVHPYVSTGIRDSKFGIRNEQVPWFLDRIRAAPLLNLVGVHCHLGSTIQDVQIFRDATFLMLQFVKTIRQEGFSLKYLNIGGGLGIDYERTNTLPRQADLIDRIRDLLTGDVTLIIEPGRSIVGNAGILVNQVLGVKANGAKHFIVVDGSMAELVRPSLYDAYHHIGFTEPVSGEVKTYEVVGPVCESTDFFGKGRQLATPHDGAGLAVHDAGAYGYAMSSNYNGRMRPPEYLVDGDRLTRIRRAEQFDEYVRLFDTT
ncbi:MAG: diaminopimelate decarboxylase [Candidatus Krumholzibacteria bacterium]|nr:diaminopimelate decarboxylase [Candidatus Krumholzibacteria bacterium]